MCDLIWISTNFNEWRFSVDGTHAPIAAHAVVGRYEIEGKIRFVAVGFDGKSSAITGPPDSGFVKLVLARVGEPHVPNKP